MKNEIRLYGPIGGWGITAEEIIDQIPEGAKEVTVRIHSPGGSVGEGIAIYHALRDNAAKVTTVVDGYAASSASFVMLAGDERKVHRNSIVFVHNPWTMAEGNADELRKIADGLDVHAQAILDIYKTHTGLDEGELKDMMDETAFFRGVDAIDNGFATGIIDDAEEEAQVAAMLKFESMAAKQEKEVMSKQKTRKDIEQELDSVQSTLGAEIEAKTVEIEALRSEHEEALKAKDEEQEAIKAELVEVKGLIEGFEAKIAEVEAAHAELAEQHETLKAEAESQGAELAKAQAALKNPAVADAVLEEANEVAKVQIDAAADEAEMKAIEATVEQEPKDELEAYERMDAGAERTKYWDENKRKILALIEKRAEGEK
jgi:ATP-dependent protease ClpP protease subunit